MRDDRQRSFGSNFVPAKSKFLIDIATRWCAVSIFSTIVWLVLANPSHAGIIVQVEDATILAGQSGYVDVFFEVDGATDEGLAGYQIELNLVGPEGVLLIGFGRPEEPILSLDLAALTVSRPALPGRTLAVNGFTFGPDAPITDRIGLIRVEFEADIGAVGVWDITVDAAPSRTSFSNGLGQLIAIQGFVGGTLTVTAIPEPTGICLGLFGALLLITNKRRTRIEKHGSRV